MSSVSAVLRSSIYGSWVSPPPAAGFGVGVAGGTGTVSVGAGGVLVGAVVGGAVGGATVGDTVGAVGLEIGVGVTLDVSGPQAASSPRIASRLKIKAGMDRLLRFINSIGS